MLRFHYKSPAILCFQAYQKHTSIGFAEVTPDMLQPYTPFHWHDCYELIYIIAGTATFQNMTHSAQVCNTGDIICTEPYAIHDMKCCPDTHFIIAMIPTAFMQKYIPELNNIRFLLPPAAKTPIIQTKIDFLQKTFFDMLVTQTFQERGYLLRFQSLLFELMYQLRHSFSVALTSHAPDTKAKDYHKQIAIDEIAAELHLQPQYFCHYFKKHFGLTFLSYVYEVRLYHIEADLIQTTHPISFIAEKPL